MLVYHITNIFIFSLVVFKIILIKQPVSIILALISVKHFFKNNEIAEQGGK